MFCTLHTILLLYSLLFRNYDGSLPGQLFLKFNLVGSTLVVVLTRLNLENSSLKVNHRNFKNTRRTTY